MLCIEELLELEELIKENLDEHLTAALTKLNRDGKLPAFLEMLGMEFLLEKETAYQVYKTGKILVVGGTEVKAEVLLGVAKELGIEKKRLELHLGYEDGKTFNFKKIQWNPAYCAVMVGPMPHSGVGKGEYGSVIAAMEAQAGYPPVIRLGVKELKITKSDFKSQLKKMIDTKIVCY